MPTLLHSCNSVTAGSNSLLAVCNVQALDTTDRLNKPLFLPCGGSGLAKVLEKKRVTGKRGQWLKYNWQNIGNDWLALRDRDIGLTIGLPAL